MMEEFVILVQVQSLKVKIFGIKMQRVMLIMLIIVWILDFIIVLLVIDLNLFVLYIIILGFSGFVFVWVGWY